jgi:hypothetical protein
MRRFWKRRKVVVGSVVISPELFGWPWIITTPPGKSVGSCVSGATGISWALHTMTPRFSSGRSTISNNPRRGQSFDYLIWDDHLERKTMTTRPYDSVSVEAIAADDAAAAVVRYQGLEAYGSSKRNKHERKNADTGLDIAIGRAFKNLGKQMENRGLKRIGDK